MFIYTNLLISRCHYQELGLDRVYIVIFKCFISRIGDHLQLGLSVYVTMSFCHKVIVFGYLSILQYFMGHIDYC